MKSEQMTIERQLNLESLTNKDFTPESFKKLFPAIIGDANAYKLWNSDLANVINITINENFDLKKDGKEDEARIGDLNKKIQEYVDFIGNSYQKGNFSQKVNILDFINSNAFIPFKYDEVKLGFRDQLIQKTKEIFQEESKEKGNYFLYTYLSSFFENDIKMDEIVSKEYKLASKDRYIKENGTELLISKLGKKERVDYLLNKVETLVLGENWDSEEMLKGEGELFKCYEELESLFDKFSSEDISIIGAKKDINETEEQNIKDYSIFLNEKVQLVFKKEFGLPLSELSLQEQLALIGYFKNSTNENVAIKKEFAKKYGVDGLRTFLSIEQEKKGENMGDKILALGEKLPKEVAEQVFKKYGEIINITTKVQEILGEILPQNIIENTQKEIFEIKESLLTRAKNLLVNFYENKEDTSEKLLKDLERYETEVLLYADTYKKLKESGKDIKLEDIKNTKIEILSQEEKRGIANELWDITIANRPFIKDPGEIEKRKKVFFSTIENNNSDFYILKHGKSVISFCSFTPDENDNICIESLNTNTEAKGSSIGSEFLPAVLEKVKNKNGGQDIYGYVHEKNINTLLYYQNMGFETKKVEKNGETKYEIRISEKDNENTMRLAA